MLYIKKKTKQLQDAQILHTCSTVQVSGTCEKYIFKNCLEEQRRRVFFTLELQNILNTNTICSVNSDFMFGVSMCSL